MAPFRRAKHQHDERSSANTETNEIYPRLDTEDSEAKCPLCDVVHPNGYSLLDHIQRRHRLQLKTEHGQFRCVYHCEGCSTVMKQWTNLKTHCNRHLGIKPHKCSVKGCHFATADQASLVKHHRGHDIIPKQRAHKADKGSRRSSPSPARAASPPPPHHTRKLSEREQLARCGAGPLASANGARNSSSTVSSSSTVFTRPLPEPELVKPRYQPYTQFPVARTAPTIQDFHNPYRYLISRQEQTRPGTSRPSLPSIRDLFPEVIPGFAREVAVPRSQNRCLLPTPRPPLTLPYPLLPPGLIARAPPQSLVNMLPLVSSQLTHPASRILQHDRPKPSLNGQRSEHYSEDDYGHERNKAFNWDDGLIFNH